MSIPEIDGLPVPPWKKTLLREMSVYGMFTIDKGSDFHFALETEVGKRYTSVGGEDKWVATAKRRSWQPRWGLSCLSGI
jgi:hypothetical protein